MGYQITYGFHGEAKRVRIWPIWLRYVGILTLCALFVVTILWISGADLAVTVSAMEDMVETLRQGEAFSNAFATFCLDVLQGAECG